MNGVPVAPHGLILGENEATPSRKLFKHLPDLKTTTSIMLSPWQRAPWLATDPYSGKTKPRPPGSFLNTSRPSRARYRFPKGRQNNKKRASPMPLTLFFVIVYAYSGFEVREVFKKLPGGSTLHSGCTWAPGEPWGLLFWKILGA